jgi:excisionase family DNA binding protein
MEKGAKFYTAREVADTLKVNIMTIYRYIKKGRIRAHKIGKDFRIDKSEFERFLKATSTK